jgi:hypothetical protein
MNNVGSIIHIAQCRSVPDRACPQGNVGIFGYVPNSGGGRGGGGGSIALLLCLSERGELTN